VSVCVCMCVQASFCLIVNENKGGCFLFLPFTKAHGPRAAGICCTADCRMVNGSGTFVYACECECKCVNKRLCLRVRCVCMCVCVQRCVCVCVQTCVCVVV